MSWFDAFLPMHTITRGRLRRARWTSLWLTLGFLGIYALTVCRTAYPGDSAELLAQFAGLTTREAFDRPILHALGGWLAAWFNQGDGSGIAYGFNLLAALLGAVGVGLFYRVAWYLIDELMREESSIRLASKVSFRAGLLSSIALATSLPFWSAATRFSTAIVDFFSLVSLLFLVTAYAHREQRRWLFLFALVAGVLSAESATFLLLMPFFAFLWIAVEWSGDARRWRPRLTLAIFIFAFGYLADHTLSMVQAGRFLGVEPSLALFYTTSLEVFRVYWRTVTSVLPGRYWIAVLATGCALLPVAWSVGLRTLRNYRGYGLLTLLTVITAALLAFQFGLPGTAWAVWAPEGVIPVVSTLATALAFVLAAACFRALVSMAPPQEFQYERIEQSLQDEALDQPGSDEPGPNQNVLTLGTLTGIAGWAILIAATLLGALLNARAVATDQARFADVLAERLMDDIGSRVWVVTDEVGGANILLAAHRRGRSVLLLQPFRTRERYYRYDVRRRFAPSVSENLRLRAERLLDQNFILFLEELFLTMPAIERQTVSLALPDLWYARDRKPRTGSVCFYGVPRGEEVNRAQVEQARKFWEECVDLLEVDAPNAHPLSARIRHLTAQRLSMIINNCAVECDDAGDGEGAYQLLRLAQRIDPENVSVALNLYDLTVSRQVHAEMADRMNRELNRIASDRSVRLPLWALGRFYGYVRNYELFLRKGLSWVMSSCPDSVLITLQNAQRRRLSEADQGELLATMGAIYAMQGDIGRSRESYQRLLEANPSDAQAIRGLARLAMQGGEIEETRRLLELGGANGIALGQLGTEWALYYLASGELEKARVLMQRCLDVSSGAGPADLALLGVIMLAQKDTKAVGAVLIPRLAQMAKSASDRRGAQYYLSLLQGCSFREQEGADAARKARAAFLQAAAIRPDTVGLMDLVLSLDVRLREEGAAELHAINILRRRRDSAFANYVLGSIRLGRGQYGDALVYLEAAVSGAKPTAAARNNYAEVLARLGRVAEAEQVARKLAREVPDFVPGLSTLAGILLRNGQADGAERLVERIRSLDSGHAGLAFLEIRVALGRGRVSEAAERVAAVKRREDSLSSWERRDLKELEAEVRRAASRR